MTAPQDPKHLPIRQQMEALIRRKQKEITEGLESIDTVKFTADTWERGNDGGGGTSMVIQNGSTFEKGGVNVSVVYGELTPGAVLAMKQEHKDLKLPESANGLPNSEGVKFFACGLSMVIHPVNPLAPTTHLNYRYFETWNPDGTPQTWWFGGGADLTPFYLFEEDAEHFHKLHKAALDKHDTALYPRFKKWCDEYFYIAHRGETRGIGGIFFDDYNEKDPQEILKICEDCFDAFLPSYLTIMKRRKDLPYNEKQKNWQLIRRGRYAEFNLIYDRGTQFGLRTPGSRVESILMSLPLHASWVYNHHPEPGSEEAKLLEVTTKPREWVN
ncbi:uncharacterized protein GVI51_K11935 [Nakaseomyces glabratus]|uniref:coproporphyrinogen oxidase n=2 Tax=Candida glabrata TaxID=5478 RepID=Q6FM03_CANGA|nr:uncharacterized protein CAGL0K12100g [Nakaseomyces glabratus]KAH7582518.1 Coproporphyrinogen III oxidase signature [Nakaseomyces glabratus]KAH7583426.1 Coproporphyrinogen III oxidase signature [Nakaseomyces glabratus]KAH7584849.1 Coproporphyrinogen III oxidase signature [Nakaseomyces glabratus]KAH7596450.1 Coproporphyrinogen III oxidase signature [Nakaseomyces glabratus]KAH7597309.1 Coproporphyrinogen III oxidase signature [Nakaseomyces glabratus]|eukprot:XP_448741.1 uncharacterized protein CAGL0K12100g [[Candida] glabrata]